MNNEYGLTTISILIMIDSAILHDGIRVSVSDSEIHLNVEAMKQAI